MTDSLSFSSEKAGLPPGTLVHVGKAPAPNSHISLLRYNAQQAWELPDADIETALAATDPGTITWVHCEGLGNIDLLDAIGRTFNVHSLVLEDILNTHQRPKFEDYDDHLFIVLKTLSSDKALTVRYEQVSILVFSTFVFTFREKKDQLFDTLRHRLLGAKGRARNNGTDYLAYVIMDTIVDQYFTIADTLEEEIEAAENELSVKARHHTLTRIQRIKRELIFIRKSIAPLREMLSSLERSDSPLIKEKTLVYFRDVFDHAIRIIETLDSYRDLVNGMLDIYLSSVSNRMNEIMKVLTVFATIFIPLTFLVGVYGMNFDYMPELHWKWAYPLLWLSFFLIPAVLLSFFKKKKWL